MEFAADADALSMRGLAQELGAGAMSPYPYVVNKGDLLDGMVDLVFDEIALPTADGGWRDTLRQRALATRDALARHPWAIGLMASRTQPGPANLQHREAVLTTLRRAGLSVTAATHANWLLDSYVGGFALQVATLPFDTKEQLADMAEQVFIPQIPADRFPYLHAAAAELVAAHYDPAAELEVGLGLILDALEGLRSGRSAPHALARNIAATNAPKPPNS
jgi:AcrR family transcriptional regulator